MLGIRSLCLRPRPDSIPVRRDRSASSGSRSGASGRSCRSIVRPRAEPLEHCDDNPAERRCIGEDVCRDRTDAGIAERGQSQIAPAIHHLRFPPAVVSTTVALDDEPPLDHEVHSSDSVDPDLALKTQAESTQQQSYERLRPRLALSVDQCTKGASAARNQPKQFVESVFVDQTEVQSAIERRDGCSRLLAEHGLQERVEDLDPQRARRRRAVQRGPVQSNPGRRPQPGRVRWHLNVHGPPVQNEDTEFGEQGRAGHSSPGPRSGHPHGRGRGMQVDALPRSQEVAVAHELGDASLRESRGLQVGVDVDVVRMEVEHLRSFARSSPA